MVQSKCNIDMGINKSMLNHYHRMTSEQNYRGRFPAQDQWPPQPQALDQVFSNKHRFSAVKYISILLENGWYTHNSHATVVLTITPFLISNIIASIHSFLMTWFFAAII